MDLKYVGNLKDFCGASLKYEFFCDGDNRLIRETYRGSVKEWKTKITSSRMMKSFMSPFSEEVMGKDYGRILCVLSDIERYAKSH
jgi:hypothetical protein